MGQVKKIAIKFGDNDFYNTFIPLLKVFLEAEYIPNNKEKICYLINLLSYPLYLLNQNSWKYNGLENEIELGKSHHSIHIKEYLRLESNQLLLNEEVDKLIEEGDAMHCFNGEIFVYDVDRDYVYCL